MHNEGTPISEIEFWKEARYGDLILFYSSLPMTGINRSINFGGFHHVAMVADRDAYHVQIFDAVIKGVRIVTWEQLRKYCGMHKDVRKEVWPRVWWRRAKFNRTD